MKRLAALAPLLLAACTTLFTPRSQHASATATTIPNMPMLKWGIESCGAGSLSTILQHYGDTTTMQQWDASLPKTRGGVMTIDMLIAARQKGYGAKLVTGDRASVESELTAGRPVILMLKVIDSLGHHYDFFHYVVADGIDPEHHLIRVQFGDGQGRWVSFERLDKAWSGGGHAAIFIRPRTQDESLRAAVSLESEGKYAEAAAQYRELLDHYKGTPLVWTNLGNAQMQLGQTRDAETSFRKALELEPSFRDALNNLAWLLYQEKHYDEAEALARKAVSQNGPDSYLVLDTLARILAARGACDEAAKTFRQAIDAVPATHTSARGDLEKGMAEAATGCVKS
ncbi:MAG TPA: tetratricopeptide repeat protein [Thermoanaerobaculia bacterium]|jgi:TolA-binding protein|nr:tetratricopeptide repeat protein [Thermoanaerobaculia bacterium]